MLVANHPAPLPQRGEGSCDREQREQQLHAVTHALARYRHEVQRECLGNDHERIVDFLVSLYHLCDERGVCLDAALHEAERLFVDQLGLGPLEGPEFYPELDPEQIEALATMRLEGREPVSGGPS